MAEGTQRLRVVEGVRQCNALVEVLLGTIARGRDAEGSIAQVGEQWRRLNGVGLRRQGELRKLQAALEGRIAPLTTCPADGGQQIGGHEGVIRLLRLNGERSVWGWLCYIGAVGKRPGRANEETSQDRHCQVCVIHR